MEDRWITFFNCLREKISEGSLKGILHQVTSSDDVENFYHSIIDFFKSGNEDGFLGYLTNLGIEQFEPVENKILSPILECLLLNEIFTPQEKIVFIKKLKKIFHELLIDRFFNLFQQSEENLLSLLDHISEIVYIHDIKGKIIFMNSAGFKLLGDVKTIWEVVDPQYKDFLKESYERFRRGEIEVFIEQIKLTGRKGQTIYLEVKSVPIYRDGQIVAFQGIARDITDSVKLEQKITDNLAMVEEEIKKKLQALQEANRKLKEINELKDTVLSQVSHELRTPLVPIKGYIDLLLMGNLGSLNEKQKKALGIISRELTRFKRLIDTLFMQTNLRSGKLMLELTTFDISEVIKDITDKFSNEASKKNVNFILNTPSLPVVGDRTKIEEVLYNLIDNAIKFNKNGGSVKINTYVRGREVAIEISDTGVGIEREEIDKIFEKYYRGLNTSPGKRGLGLGLFIVRRILQVHGSHFTVESQPGEGTTFRFFLPRGDMTNTS